MELLARHWTTLHEFELVTDEPSQVLRGVDDDGRPYYVELFTWASDRAAERAHEVPEVLGIWEPMEQACEARDGRPACEFPHLHRVEVLRVEG